MNIIEILFVSLYLIAVLLYVLYIKILIRSRKKPTKISRDDLFERDLFKPLIEEAQRYIDILNDLKRAKGEVESKWIHTNISWPLADKRVLVCDKDESIVISRLVHSKQLGSRWLDDDHNMHDAETVTRWMPIPE